MIKKNRYLEVSCKSPQRYNAGAQRQQNVIGQKIKQERKRQGFTLSTFSQELNQYGLAIQRQGLNKWETGAAVPNAYQLMAVCHALHIQEGVSFFTGETSLYDQLNEEGLKKLEDYREDLIASGRYKPRAKAKCLELRYKDMPVSTLPASAGTGNFLDQENFEIMSFPESAVPTNADFGVWVSGDSMEPVYHDGQVVWVQKCAALNIGEVGIFLYDGEGYIKVYDEQEPSDEQWDTYLDSEGVLRNQPVLVSYNKAYPPRPVSPELSFAVIGRVLN